MIRSFLSISLTVLKQQSNNKSCQQGEVTVCTLIYEIDQEYILSLLVEDIYLPSHTSIVRLAQCIAITLLDAIYIGEKRNTTSSISNTNNTNLNQHNNSNNNNKNNLNSLSKDILEHNEIFQILKKYLQVPYTINKPSRKIASVSITQFIKYISILHPILACDCLAELCLAHCKASGDDNGESVGLFTSEMYSLSEGGVLSTLLISQVDVVVSVIIIPVLYLIEENFASAIDILQLFEKIVYQYNPDVSYLLYCRSKIFASLAIELSVHPIKCLALIKILKDCQADIPILIPNNSLFDEMPTIYQELFNIYKSTSYYDSNNTTSSNLDINIPYKRIISESVIYQVFNSLTKALDINISEPSSCIVNKQLSVSTYHQMLLSVIWQLGSMENHNSYSNTNNNNISNNNNNGNTNNNNISNNNNGNINNNNISNDNNGNINSNNNTSNNNGNINNIDNGSNPCDAIHILSYQTKENSWFIRDQTNNYYDNIVEEIDKCLNTADILQADFLYILSNLLMHGGGIQSQTQLHQEQSLLCIKSMIDLLVPKDLIKFLPKIMIIVDSALEGSSIRVRLTAVELTCALCKVLPLNTLKDLFSTLVIGLFPLLELPTLTTNMNDDQAVAVLLQEGSKDIPIDPSTITTTTTNNNNTPTIIQARKLAGSDLHVYGRLGMIPSSNNTTTTLKQQQQVQNINLNNALFIPDISTRCNDQGISKIIALTCATVYANELDLIWTQEVKSKAITLIKDLFITRRKKLQMNYIQTIAYIPNIPELKSVSELHQQEVLALTLEQSLKILCNMLTHSSVHVRLVAVNRIYTICKQNKPELDRIIHQTSITNEQSNLGTTISDLDILSLLLQSLLQLCVRESNLRVQAACARCLGELGAVDPSRVKVKLSSDPKQTVTDTSPWYCSCRGLGLYLLEYHLVPELRSAAGSDLQDKSAFAIQDTLKYLYEVITVDHLHNSSNKMIKNNIPDKLKTLLASKGILEVVEPFWSTSYTMSESYIVRKPPIYQQGLSFLRWISLFTRYLISQSKGSSSPFYQACRGVLRNRSELCQFLLPHLIVNVLGFEGDDDAETGGGESKTSSNSKDSVMLNVIKEEIMLVLQHTTTNTTNASSSSFVPSFMNTIQQPSTITTTAAVAYNTKSSDSKSSHQMCIQSIFSLLDTLTTWITKSKLKSWSSTRTVVHLVQINQGLDKVNILLDHIPKDILSDAALYVHAYARALRYLDIYTREQHRRNRLNSNTTATINHHNNTSIASSVIKSNNDHANGELPILSSAQIDKFITIYANLEDSDALQGTLVMSHIYNIPSTIHHRILELELTDDWLSALQEYGLQQNSQIFSKSLQYYERKHYINKHSTINNNNNSNSSSMSRITNEKLLSLEEISEYERRKLRCLVELGHYEAVIDQSSALMSRVSELEQSLLPLATEASWRLMRWNDLEAFVTRYDTSSSSLSRYSSIQSDYYHHHTNTSNSNNNNNLMKTLYSHTQVLRQSSILSEYECGRDSGSGSDSVHMLDSDHFQLSVGKLMLAMQRRERSTFAYELENARKQTMLTLSAASMESYGRAYPMLTRLHILHELECGYEMLLLPTTTIYNSTNILPHIISSTTIVESNILNNSYSNSYISNLGNETRLERLHKLHWDNRLQFMLPSIPQRSTLLAVRRCILGLCDMPQLVAENWLALSNSMRQLGKFDSAILAVRNAESYGLSSEVVLLQECRILRDNGQIQKALMKLEPVELDLSYIYSTLKIFHNQNNTSNTNASSSSTTTTVNSRISLPSFLDTELKRHILSERIQLATQLMIDSHQQQGNEIINRYRTVIVLNKHWPQAFYDLARYYEFLYHESRTRQLAYLLQETTDSQLQSVAKVQQFQHDCTVMYGYLKKSIQKYGECLYIGVDLVMQALPRMLTLWLSFTAIQYPAWIINFTQPSNKTSTNKNNNTTNYTISTALITAKQDANNSMLAICKTVPASTWFVCTSQLVSRTLHSDKDTVKTITQILLKILLAFPKQGIWHIACLINSLNNNRKKFAKDLVTSAIKELVKENRQDDAQMLNEIILIFKNLIELANLQLLKERKAKWNFPVGLQLNRILVPTQAVLHQSNPLRLLNTSSVGSSHIVKSTHSSYVSISSNKVPDIQLSSNNNYYNSDQMFIESFQDQVDVAVSKAKPKTIYVRTICGKTVKFLCKLEKDGDLRKDARMMEFNTTVNRLLLESPEGKKRHLHVRTFAVICLNEECGVLEWVNNTECMRHLITQAHSYWLDIYPTISHKDIMQPFVENQTVNEDNLPVMVTGYSSLTIKKYKPCFHRWFLEQFQDPTAWQEARMIYIHSVAVWSTVGHIIGLGDRHIENILLDTMSGECIHVDFDCLFDKGLALSRPEIVPFRLTPNMVDAMGPMGVEGVYRRSMEVTVSVLRENKETLLSVLEPFLRDPTVAWSRSGRAQRNISDTITTTTVNNKTNNQQFNDIENKEATDMLKKITERLNGIYNIIHPYREKFLRGASKRNELPPIKGLCANKEEMHSLSATGQIQRLIDEATAVENLAQMYVGWQPWA